MIFLHFASDKHKVFEFKLPVTYHLKLQAQ